MRNILIVPNEHYHIYNRGTNKQDIFLDTRDWVRFLFLIIYFQSSSHIYNIGFYVSNFIKNSVFNISERKLKEITEKRAVKLINFCLMPNHFHLTVRETQKGGIPKYMEKVQKAYTKYFNAKYKRSGHLFQGPYKIVYEGTEEQMLYLSAYIHRNPRELKEWKNKEDKYPWSSFQDYLGKNRWGILLETDDITKKFPTTREYFAFVNASGAKQEKTEEIILE